MKNNHKQQNLVQEKIMIERGAFSADQGLCFHCKTLLVKHVERHYLRDQDITIPILFLRCQQCGKDYLNLAEAEKYQLFLRLEKNAEKQLAL